MIGMIAHLGFAKAREAEIFFAVHEFGLRKFMNKEITVDRLIETADLRICFFKNDMRHFFIDAIAIREGLDLAVDTNDCAFHAERIPVVKAALDRLLLFLDVSVTEEPVVDPRLCILQILLCDSLVLIVCVLAKESVQMILLHAELLARQTDHIVRPVDVLFVVPVFDEIIFARHETFNLLCHPGRGGLQAERQSQLVVLLMDEGKPVYEIFFLLGKRRHEEGILPCPCADEKYAVLLRPGRLVRILPQEKCIEGAVDLLVMMHGKVAVDPCFVFYAKGFEFHGNIYAPCEAICDRSPVMALLYSKN